MADSMFFVDESGHAGINYLDSAQPYHVAAGFLLSSSSLDDARELVRNGEGPQVPTKASGRLRSHRGRKQVLQLLRDLGVLRGVPFFVIMDRRFSLVGKIVDVFLDPAYHDGLAWLPTSDIKRRKALVEKLSDELDDGLLVQFADAYRSPTVEGFGRVLECLIRDREARGDQLLRGSFEVVLSVLETVVDHENYDGALGKHGALASLNVPAVTHLLRLVDRAAQARGVRYSVVHDQNAEFEKALTFMATTLAHDHAEPDIRWRDGTLFRRAFVQLDRFEMMSSKAEPLLRASDQLATTITYICKAAMQPAALRDSLFAELAGSTLPALMEDEPLFGAAYAHDRTIARFLLAAMGKI